jgi:tRNA(Ile)-lysidine synthase
LVNSSIQFTNPIHQFTNSPIHELPVATLAVRVLGTIRRQGLMPAGARVLVALSGGGDSVALLLVLQSLHDQGEIVLVGAAHLNHQLRAEADEDEAFCRRLVQRCGLAFVSERVDVAALARQEKRSIEDAARRARYAFLVRAADEVEADFIATGHTRDDQAETFLLRILRGAGTRGLGGIRPRNGRVIRPLLDVTRDDLRACVAAHGEQFREDASNMDVRIPRNRVRHELMPLLQSRFSAAVVDILAREAELARRDEDFLQRQAIDLARRIVLSENASEIRMAAAALDGAHPALSSRVARLTLERFSSGRAIGFEHVDSLLGLARRQSDGAIALPGQDALRLGTEVVLRPARRGPGAIASSFAFPLSIPGEVQAVGWAIAAANAGRSAASRPWAGRGTEVGIPVKSLSLPLAVRNRRPGDRFRPLGSPGKRKLQDFFVDRKVPRAQRDVLPLVVDAQDRIVWVPGQAVAEEFKVSDPSQAVILLSLRRLGGQG